MRNILEGIFVTSLQVLSLILVSTGLTLEITGIELQHPTPQSVRSFLLWVVLAILLAWIIQIWGIVLRTWMVASIIVLIPLARLWLAVLFGEVLELVSYGPSSK